MTRQTAQALLFDFNGVLIDDEEQHYEALRTVLGAEGIELSRERYYADYMGFDDRMCFLEAFRRAGREARAAELDDLIERKARVYERLMARHPGLMDGAAEFVRRAAGEFLLAVVSGALRREIERALERAGVRRYFSVVVAAEDVERCKPDPEGYLAARRELERAEGPRGELPPARCIVLEDSLPGLAAARAAGMRAVALATTHPADRLDGADLVWRSLAGHDPRELLVLLGR